jgi:YVTN family beta-propeller protein
VDFAERKVAATIKLPDEGGGQSPPRGVFSHGMGVTPDNKTLWVNSTLADAVFAYSLPDLKLLGHVRTGIYPIWITFSPDSKTVYDSNRADNTVSVIDVRSLKEVTRIQVGEAPERNATLELPYCGPGMAHLVISQSPASHRLLVGSTVCFSPADPLGQRQPVRVVLGCKLPASAVGDIAARVPRERMLQKVT